MRTDAGYQPTPLQIAVACKEIQDRWPPGEHQRRWVSLPAQALDAREVPSCPETAPFSSRVCQELSEATA